MLRTKEIAMIIIAAICLSCGEDEEIGGLAKIGNEVVTLDDLEARLKGMPPFMMEQLNTPEGRQRLLKAIVEEEIIVREARARGLDKTEEFKNEIEMRERDVLVNLFYEKVIDTGSAPSDSEVVAFYESHADEFTTPEAIRGRHILVKTEREAARLRQRLEEGADFAQLASAHSLDAPTKDRGGILHGEITRGAPIKGLGEVPEVVEACFALAEGEVSQPVKTSMGYHIVRVDRRTPERLKPLDEVRKGIVDRLSYENRPGVRNKVLDDLKSKYKVVFLSESSSAGQSPEEVFKTASEESDPRQKIAYYREFTDRFPDDERVYEAQFMIGFTLAEDLSDYDAAEEAFREFLRAYPETDLSDDAKWMLENMRSGGQPDFESD